MIRNRVNGKVYVGQTVQSIQYRWGQHVRDAHRRVYPIHHAINKYGPDGFEISELARAASLADLNALESVLIAEYRANDKRFGYNVRAGGDSGGKLHPETIEKLRQIFTGRPAPNKGKPMPSHQREEMMARFRTRGHPASGRACSAETRAKIGAANRISKLGSKASDNTKQKMKEARLRFIESISLEQRGKLFRHMVGAKRADLSAFNKKRFSTGRYAERRALVVQLRDSGMTWDAVASSMKVHRSTVQEIYQNAKRAG